jgi:hypothetical protein
MNRTKTYLNNLVNKIITETLMDKADEVMEKIKSSEFDYIEEEETCEQCDAKDEMMEKLHGKQHKLDKNKNGKIDKNDFKMLRGEMSEGETCEQCGSREMFEGECVECGMKKGVMDEEDVEEGNAFSGALNQAKKSGEKSFKVDGKTYPVKDGVDETFYRLVDGEDSALFTENEIIDIIENIVKEEKEKDNIKKGVTPKGLSAYETAHKGSGKENKEYLESVAKKMVDYIKDGSKGEYETNPKHFPKGNGQLEKMEAKKYTMSDDGKDFLNDFMHPGMENLDYDQIQPNDDWMKKNIEGSSETGNNPEWANAEETELGKKINKKRKENKYAKAKRTAYRKSKQPITDEPGENSGGGVDIKLESVDRKTEKLNEEFQRIQQLMGYTQKTQ